MFYILKKIKMLKKIGSMLMLGLTTLALTANSYTFAQGSTVQQYQWGGFGATKVQGLQVWGTSQKQGEGLIGVITNLVNYGLGLLSLITLLVLLYGGFQMVTAAGDSKKYESGFEILKQAGIGLAFIFLSWFFISFVFFLLGNVGTSENIQ